MMAEAACSFCEKRENEVRALVPGVGAAICDECLDLCSDIITEEEEQAALLRRSRAEMQKLGVRDEERPQNVEDHLVCSFCEQGFRPGSGLIAGPAQVYICKGCVRRSIR